MVTTPTLRIQYRQDSIALQSTWPGYSTLVSGRTIPLEMSSTVSRQVKADVLTNVIYIKLILIFLKIFTDTETKLLNSEKCSRHVARADCKDM